MSLRRNGQEEIIIDNTNCSNINNNVVNETNRLSVNIKPYLKIFLFLSLGLLISAITSIIGATLLDIFIYSNEEVVEDLSLAIFIVLLVASLAGSFLSSYFVTKNRAKRSEKKSAIVPYLLYSLCMGIVLSSLVYYVENPFVLGFTFLITAILLFLLGLVAYFSKGKGLLVALFVAIFLAIGGAIMYLFTFLLLPLFFTTLTTSFLIIFFVIEMVFLAVFMIYTSIDFFMIKKEIDNSVITNSDCIYFALLIYSDFIAIFIRLLRILTILNTKKR